MVGRAWEDALLQEREENKRLKVQQMEQAAREERLAKRLVQLKERREALLEGKSVQGHSRDGKIRELREKIDDLSTQHRDLRAKLEVAKRKGPAQAGAAAKRGVQPGSGTAEAKSAKEAAADKSTDPHEPKIVIADLKNKILESNVQIKRLEEQRAATDLRSTLDLYRFQLGGTEQDLRDRELLLKELKEKQATYELAKAKLEKLDGSYKEYVKDHKELLNKAGDMQQEILEQQKQHRQLEGQIKQLKLHKEHDGDLKSILDDVKEEVALLNEENMKLKADSMSGQKVMQLSQVHNEEVVKLREENTELEKTRREQLERSQTLSKRLEEAVQEQQSLALELKKREESLAELRNNHGTLTAKLKEFSLDSGTKTVAAMDERGGEDKGSGEGRRGMGEPEAAMVKRLVTELKARGVTEEATFDTWNKSGDRMLSLDEFVSGVESLQLNLQLDDARQLYWAFVAGEGRGQGQQGAAVPRARFVQVLKSVDVHGEGGGQEEVEILRAEVRKLRTVKDQLLQEKDELFQTLRDKDRVRRDKVMGSDAAQSERLREVERSQAEEIAALETELSVALYNQQDLLHIIQSAERSRVRPTDAVAVKLSKLSNVLVLEISNVSLNPNRDLWPDDYPITFLSIDFYAHGTQVTYPATGLDVNVGWSCEFEVEVDNLFIEYLDSKTVEVELMQRVNKDVPFHKVAVAPLSLRALLERPSISAQRVNLVAVSGRGSDTGGYVVGDVTVNARILQPLTKAVEKYRSTNKQAGVRREAAVDAVKAGLPPDVKLAVTIEYVEGVRAARFGKVPWPYVQYELPMQGGDEEGHVTKTVKDVLNGTRATFGDTKVWELQGEVEVESLRTEELEVFVFDDNVAEDDDEDEYLGSATVKLAPLFLPNQRSIQAVVDLKDPSKRTNGALSIRLEWKHQAFEEARPRFEAAQPERSRKPRVARKLQAEPERPEEAWLEQLRASLSSGGHSVDNAFLSFDRDGDGEINLDDFEETMKGQPLTMSGAERLQLFEYLAGGKNQSVSRSSFKKRMEGETVAEGKEDDQLLVSFAQLIINGNSSIFESLPEQVAVVTDWFAQDGDEGMKVHARKVLRRDGKAVVEVNHKAVFDLGKKRNLLRVEAVMQKEGRQESDDVAFLLCAVGSGGVVDTGSWLAKGKLDVQDVLHGKEELTDLALQLEDQEEKPCANLHISTKMLAALQRLKVGEVGAAGAATDKGSKATWEEREAGRLAKKLADKGLSTKEAFRRFDENCDGAVDFEEFEAALQGERMDLPPEDTRRLFNYLAGGRDGIELKSWDDRLRLGAVVEAAGAVGAGEEARGNVVVILKQVTVRPEAWERLGGRDGDFAGFKAMAVEVDFLKQPPTEPLPTTKRQPLADSSNKEIMLNDKIVIPLSGGRDDQVAAANRQKVLSLLKQGVAQAPRMLEVILVGFKSHDARDGVEIGKAELDLKALWDDGEDLSGFPLQLQKDDRAVGNIHIAVFFMQALQSLNIKSAKAADSGPSSSAHTPAPPSARQPAEPSRGQGRVRTAEPAAAAVGVTTEGALAVEVSEVEVSEKCEVMREEKARSVFVMVNFFGAQTDREVEKLRSTAISIDALRDQPVNVKYSCQLPVNEVQNSANLELLEAALTTDEDDKQGLLTVLLSRSPYAGEYTAKASETVEIGRGFVSVCDALHCLAVGEKDADGAVEVPITAAAATDDVGRVTAKVVFKQLELACLRGRTFQEEEKARAVLVQMRWVRLEGPDWKGKLFKTVRSVSVAIQLQGEKSWLEPHSRQVRVRDSGGDRKFRGALTFNHTFELSLLQHTELRDSLLDGLKSEVTLLLLDTSTSETRVLGTAKRDLRKIVEERTDKSKEEIELLDTSGSKVGRAQVDFAVVKAVATLQAPAAESSASDKVPDTEKMSLNVDRLALIGGDGSVLDDSKAVKVYTTVRWFGHDWGSASRPLPKSMSVPVQHDFSIDLSGQPPHSGQSFRTWRELVGGALSGSLGSTAKQTHIEVVVWWQSSRDESERVGVGVVDLNAVMADGAEGELELPLVSDPSVSRSRQLGTVHIKLSALAALSTVPFRSPSRQPPKSDEETALVIRCLEGAQVASAQEKEGNFVVCVKSLELTNSSISSKGRRAGPVFVAVNVFGEALKNRDVCSMSGGFAKLKQKRVDFGERFLFGISSEQKANRNAIKGQLDKLGSHGVEIEIMLMSEPWAEGDHPWAEGFLSLEDCKDKDGQDMLVELADGDDREKRGHVIVQVHLKEAMKRLGKA